MTKLRLAGLLLILGSAITLGLHFRGVPEGVYRWLYDNPLSSLDVPDEPSQGSLDLLRYVSLIGGLAELAVGVGLLAFERVRSG